MTKYYLLSWWSSALFGFVTFYFAWDLNILALDVGVRAGEKPPGQVDILLLPLLIGLLTFVAMTARAAMRELLRK